MNIKNYLDKILIAGVIIIIIAIGIYNKQKDENIDNVEILNNTVESDLENKKTSSDQSKKDKTQDEDIYVHVTGCVKNSGVFKLNNTSRVKDLIDKAGGFCKEVDFENINLSQKLKDEMKIHVYKIGEVKVQNSQTDLESKSSTQGLDIFDSSKVNINTASKDKLMTLPGVGSSRADQIIKYREKNKFQTIEDIQSISGIGQKSFEKIKEKITVDWNYAINLI